MDEFRLGELSSTLEDLVLQVQETRRAIDGNLDNAGLRTRITLLEVELANIKQSLEKRSVWWTNWKLYVMVGIASTLVNLFIKGVLHW
jgi:hypothetical protein